MKSRANKKFQIRFNTQSKLDSDKWRIVSDSGEILVSNIIIDSKTYTTKDHIEDVGDKWHISCTGNLMVENGIAHITVKKEDDAVIRHILKTITYRILGTLTTFTAAYIMTGDLNVSGAIGIGELIFKPVLYFIHERIWYSTGVLRGK